ncbi:T9SS type A sorting domain-containing protein [Flavobacterium rhizosphaerae]|uniref:T9SS type A sorting domain-containing protein n=1 Tax=Flavobacterium rhizosphaerae TaxID=3163298 RepID=A0ABW8Z0B6_9FLAO
MKKIYLFTTLFLGITVMSAQENINFEATGNGTNYTWNVFENDTNPPLEFVANPDPSGINTSSMVAKYTTLETGMPYAGCETSHEMGMADFVLDAEHSTVKIMVYKSVISNVGIKLVTPGSAALPEVLVPNTVINQWEELTFDMSESLDLNEGPFDQIVVFPDYSGTPRTYGTITYFDNITFGTAENMDDVPMTAAPDPTWPEGDVISMFSGVYTNVAVDTWLTEWSAAGLVDIQIEGNDTKKYTNLNYAGIETVATQIDASGMEYFNVDVWSPNFTQLRIKLVDFGANAVYDGAGAGDDVEHEITYATPAQSQWITYSIPLSDFTGLTTKEHISQLIFSTDNLATVYVDNVFFSKNPVSATTAFNKSAIKIYPNPATDVLHIRSTTVIDGITVYNTLGQEVLQLAPNAETIAVDTALLAKGVYSITISSEGKTSNQKFIKS